MYRKEQEEYIREQEHAHWGCAFFRHCWNEGLKLPTQNNYPECSDRYTKYRQDIANRRSVHERIVRVHPSDGRRLKINKIDDQRGKGMLITGGLIMKKKKIMGMSGKRDSGAHLV
jgi:hypothetical protein